MRGMVRVLLFPIILILITPHELGRSASELLISSIPLRGQLSDNPHIRILVMKNQKKVTLEVRAPYELIAGNETMQMSPTNPNIVIALTESGIQFGSLIINASLIKIKTKNQHFEIDGKSFRDDLVISRNSDSTFNIINDIGVEDYLKGVLPWEVSADWPMETLKAQAIASRTYAVFKMLERAGQEHVLTSDVLAQVYVGKRIEKARTNQAIDETRGIIMMSGNFIFPGFFHSACAGQTTRAEYVWRIQPNAVLSSVPCSFCVGSKHDKWKTSLSLKKIESQIAARGFTISPIQNIQLADPDPSGRARKVLIEHSKGTLVLDGNDFRVFVGPDAVRSTRMTVSVRGDMAYFSGSGWGHGVGLCQWGSKKMGELGKTYPEILLFYYPGSTLRNVYSAQSSLSQNNNDDLSFIERMEQAVNEIFS